MKITTVEGVLLSAVLAEPHVVRWSGGEMQIASAAGSHGFSPTSNGSKCSTMAFAAFG